MTDALEEYLNTFRPWRPEYVRWQDRRPWEVGLAVHRRGPFPGEAAFWSSPELGGRGVHVRWVSRDSGTAVVELNVPLSGDPQGSFTVPLVELYETMAMANLVAWGRGIVRYAATPEGYSYVKPKLAAAR